MIAKEQAMLDKEFIQVIDGKAYTWRANGKCKTWIIDKERFKLPIKHGLYNYGYLTNENCNEFTEKYAFIKANRKL